MPDARDRCGDLAAGRRREAPPGRCRLALAAAFLALLVAAAVFAAQAFGAPCARCPPGWVPFGGSCYGPSAAQGSWTDGRDNCSALGAALAVLPGAEDVGFAAAAFGAASGRWIGLRRSDERQPWRWADGSRPPPPSSVRGGGRCGYVDGGGLGSSACGARRSWLCAAAGPPGPKRRCAGSGSRHEPHDGEPRGTK